MGKTIPLAERFWAKVKKTEGCWLWTGSKARFGYGKIGTGRRSGKTVTAHRVSFEMHCGPIPEGLCVLHRCDTPACVNPLHLFLGTYRDNNIDKVLKGRDKSPAGERHYATKLTDAQVAEIKASKESQTETARRFGVHQSRISQLRSGWRGPRILISKGAHP